MSLRSRQSLQNKQCFHNLYAYLSAARNILTQGHGFCRTKRAWMSLPGATIEDMDTLCDQNLYRY